MNNPDTDNTGYTVRRSKVRENRIGNQVWKIQTPTILGTQYTEQRLEKTGGQSNIDNPDTNNTRYTMHRPKIKKNPKGQSRMNNQETNYNGYTTHRTKGRENRRGNQEWTIQTPITLGTQYT